VYRQFLAGLGNGLYMIPAMSDGIDTNLTNSALRTGNLRFGFDVGNTRTILSFGSPVLDGWGTLGQFSAISKARRRAANERLKIIQVETAHSRTAQLADEWVPVKPGTEAVFALGLANVMINEKLCGPGELAEHSADFHNRSGHSFVDLVRGYSLAGVSGKTGVSAERITRIASELASRKPSVVMFGGNSAAGPFSLVEQLAFMDLNILLGAVGAKGGLVAPRELPGPFVRHMRLAAETLLADVPDHSIGLLIIDGADSGDALPWIAIRRKLMTQGPVVVSLSSHLAGVARHADYLLPSPAYMEAAGDSPTPASASSASYGISTPVASAPVQTIQPLDFVRRLDAAIHTNPDPVLRSMGMKQLLRTRIERIHSEQRGKVFNSASGKSTKLSSVSLAAFSEILEHGGCWVDDEPAGISSAHYIFLGAANSNFEHLAAIADRAPEDGKLVLLPIGTRGTGTIAQENSMMSKLYRESDLRMPADSVSVNPETGRKHGLADSAKATIRTEYGSVDAKVRFDPAVMPDVLEGSVGPRPGSFDRVETEAEVTILEICKVESDSTWRITKAEVTPA
jgi:anaerobic selenocysteine-containing dehydrogenase